MTDTVESTLPASLTGLLFPLADRTLLLPHVAMAELISFRVLPNDMPAPAWLMGRVEWRDLRLPLLSFEAANGQPAPAPGTRARIAVLNALGGRDNLKFFGLMVQGIPRSVRLDRGLAAANVPLDPLERSAAQVGEQVARVPDLLGLERLLVEAGLV